MEISQLNGLTLQFGFASWGLSYYGEPSWLSIAIYNGEVNISKLIKYPEEAEFTERIQAQHLDMFPWNKNVTVKGGYFIIHMTGNNDELLRCRVLSEEWRITDIHESVEFLRRENSYALPHQTISFLFDLYEIARERLMYSYKKRNQITI